ncbi:MAG: hypothetical protein DRN35_05800, partial [Thermoplasmata archaeon]
PATSKPSFIPPHFSPIKTSPGYVRWPGNTYGYPALTLKHFVSLNGCFIQILTDTFICLSLLLRCHPPQKEIVLKVLYIISLNVSPVMDLFQEGRVKYSSN